MNTKPNLIISLVVLLAGMMLLVACNPNQPNVVSASGPEPMEAIAAVSRSSAGFSGDDSYDPAAALVAPAEEVSAMVSTGNFSGDDAYDPAASLAIEILPEAQSGASYSGDDAYDPAAGGE